jgi:hypothetical protein
VALNPPDPGSRNNHQPGVLQRHDPNPWLRFQTGVTTLQQPEQPAANSLCFV